MIGRLGARFQGSIIRGSFEDDPFSCDPIAHRVIM